MTAIPAYLPDSARQALREADPPKWLEPMLATLTDKRFSDEEWIFERKLDGERCLALRGERAGNCGRAVGIR